MNVLFCPLCFVLWPLLVMRRGYKMVIILRVVPIAALNIQHHPSSLAQTNVRIIANEMENIFVFFFFCILQLQKHLLLLLLHDVFFIYLDMDVGLPNRS